MYRWAIELAKASKYEGAGTVEFLCDANSRDFYFMEVNTRLQVEHLVSQCINHQIDLVELQLRVGVSFMSGRIDCCWGIHSINRSFIISTRMPSSFFIYIQKRSKLWYLCNGMSCLQRRSSKVGLFSLSYSSHFLPGDGVVFYHDHVTDHSHTLIENNVVSSTSIPGISYDPMLLKVVTTGQSRLEVIDRMIQTLHRCNIYGVPTNIPFLINLLQEKHYRESGADSKTVSEFGGISETYDPLEISNAIAGYLFSQCGVSDSISDTDPWTQCANYCNSHDLTRIERMKVNSVLVDYKLSGDRTKPNSYTLQFNDQTVSIGLIRSSDQEMCISVDHELVQSYVYSAPDGSVHVFPVTATDHFPRTSETDV